MATKQAQVGKQVMCPVRGCTALIYAKPNRLETKGTWAGTYVCPKHLKSPQVKGSIPKKQTLAAWAASPKLHPSAAEQRAAERVTVKKADPKKLRTASTLEEVKKAAKK